MLTSQQAQQMAQLVFELYPGYGSAESLIQVISGHSSLTGEEVSRFWAAVGVIPVAGGVLKKVGEPAAETLSALLKRSDAAQGGTTNVAMHELYKDGQRAAMERPPVSDPVLSDLIGALYRENATVGSGSTADAVRHELSTGDPVGGAFHSQKATDSIRAIERWLSNNLDARSGDRAAAENVVKDMRNALLGR